MVEGCQVQLVSSGWAKVICGSDEYDDKQMSGGRPLLTSIKVDGTLVRQVQEDKHDKRVRGVQAGAESTRVTR